MRHSGLIVIWLFLGMLALGIAGHVQQRYIDSYGWRAWFWAHTPSERYWVLLSKRERLQFWGGLAFAISPWLFLLALAFTRYLR
jgi:hypothetical protein